MEVSKEVAKAVPWLFSRGIFGKIHDFINFNLRLKGPKQGKICFFVAELSNIQY